MTIVVCPLSRVPEQCVERRPSHLITLLDPDHPMPTPQELGSDRHLVIGVHDIVDETDGLLRPDESVVERILAFGAAWDPASTMLIHCWAGISRSTATAFTLACERNPGAERDIAEEIRRQSRYASPNRRIVALADARLGRGGAMVAAIDAIGRGVPAMEGEPFELRSIW